MKARLGSHKPFLFLALSLIAVMSVAGCSSGPDIKPPAPAAGASAPSAKINDMQNLLAALDRNLVELWQEQARMQQVVASLSKARRGGDCDAEQAGLAQVELQESVQQINRSMTTISNLLKNAHDQQNATVQNVR